MFSERVRIAFAAALYCLCIWATVFALAGVAGILIGLADVFFGVVGFILMSLLMCFIGLFLLAYVIQTV